MPFTWRITINKSGNGYTYDPNPLTQIEAGDEVIWTNNDDKPHWPGLSSNGTINQTYFMPYQIAPHAPSTTFVPSAAGTLQYIDSLDPTGPSGSIEVS